MPPRTKHFLNFVVYSRRLLGTQPAAKNVERATADDFTRHSGSATGRQDRDGMAAAARNGMPRGKARHNDAFHILPSADYLLRLLRKLENKMPLGRARSPARGRVCDTFGHSTYSAYPRFSTREYITAK